MQITNDIKYIGVNDHIIDLFEGQYKVPNGMSYNSYVIIDEKIAIMDTVDAKFKDEWLKNIETLLGGKAPDYLIVQHMEPDHSANIDVFLEKYPTSQVISSDKSFAMMKQFFGNDYADRKIAIKDGDTLSLGKHTLAFIAAPMVHWPEVMVTYDVCDKVLFSADAFGKFGALDIAEDWADEARRYYFGIVGKYGLPAQKLLARASTVDIATICPLHGPVLKENLGYYIGLYQTWSSYTPESEGIAIFYTSVYGNTKKAVNLLAEMLQKRGCNNLIVTDLARSDMSRAVENAFRYSKIVLATTTYNTELFPFMREFINELKERAFQNRTIGIIENGSWAPTPAKIIKKEFEGSKNITFTENTVTIRSALSDESREQISALADELLK